METSTKPLVPQTDPIVDDIFALLKAMDIVSIVIYSVAFVLGVTGNGLVIFITGFRMKKTVNTVWFLNLAIADFTFTLILLFTIVYLAMGFHWPFELAMCELNNTLAQLNFYASIYLLMVISIDRCISVRYPVWSQNHRTPRLASFVALGVWIVALVLCSPNIHFQDTSPDPNFPNMIYCYNNYGSIIEKIKMRQQAVAISRFLLAFVIPFSVIVICYGAIILRLRRNQLTNSTKPFKVIIAVILAFFVCWFPHHVFAIIAANVEVDIDLALVLHIGIHLTSSLGFINSCLNPILYVFMGHDFKESVRRSFFSAFENVFVE